MRHSPLVEPRQKQRILLLPERRPLRVLSPGTGRRPPALRLRLCNSLPLRLVRNVVQGLHHRALCRPHPLQRRRVIRIRLLLVSRRLISQPAKKQRVLVVRISLQQQFRHPEQALRLIALIVHEPQLIVGIPIPGVRLNALLQIRDRLLPVLLCEMIPRKLHLEPAQPLVVDHILILEKILQRMVAHLERRHRVVRMRLRHVLVLPHRVGPEPLLPRQIPQKELVVNVLRVQPDGLLDHPLRIQPLLRRVQRKIQLRHLVISRRVPPSGLLLHPLERLDALPHRHGSHLHSRPIQGIYHRLRPHLTTNLKNQQRPQAHNPHPLRLPLHWPPPSIFILKL